MKKKSLEVIEARILLFLLGVFFGLIALLLVMVNYTEKQGAFLLISMVVFIILGSTFLISPFLLSDKKALVWAGNTGHHAVLILFILLAHGIASFYASVTKNS